MLLLNRQNTLFNKIILGILQEGFLISSCAREFKEIEIKLFYDQILQIKDNHSHTSRRSLGQKLPTMNIQNSVLKHLQLKLGAKLGLLHTAFASKDIIIPLFPVRLFQVTVIYFGFMSEFPWTSDLKSYTSSPYCFIQLWETISTEQMSPETLDSVL